MVFVLGALLTALYLGTLAWMYLGASGRFGPVGAALIVAAVAPLAFVGLDSMRVLRVAHLVSRIVLSIGGALITLMLAYSLEHADAGEDPLLGAALASGGVALAATVGAEARIQYLETVAERERDRLCLAAAEREEERHRELVAAVASMPAPTKLPQVTRARVATVVGTAFLAFVIGRGTRPRS